MNDWDWFGIWICSWVQSVEAINVGHEKEIIRLNHGSCDGGKGIVVAEFDFLLDQNSLQRVQTYCYRKRIVLVDNRNHAHVEQLEKGVLSIDILRSLPNVSLVDHDASPQHLHRQYHSLSAISEQPVGVDEKRDCPRE